VLIAIFAVVMMDVTAACSSGSPVTVDKVGNVAGL
jgi:hypothetical protein